MEAAETAVLPRQPLYRHIADEIEELVVRGTWRPGDRIPSVRAQSRQRGVSITTVLEAYRTLEDRGVIEARPQSGYFVRARLVRPVEEPRVSIESRAPRAVGNRELMSVVLRDIRDPDIVQLAAALPHPSMLPLEKLNRGLARVARRSARLFDPPQGTLELRTQIARRAFTAGMGLTPDDILVTNGCQEAIYLALRATCRPGDTVAVESPTFYGFLQAIEHLGLRVLEVATYPRHGACLDSIRRAIRRHRVRAFLLSTSFANPLGSCMPAEKKEELVRILAREEIPLIEDDLCADLGHGLERPKAAKAWDRKGLVLLCSSFSKTLAPGYRIGWIVPGRFGDAVRHHKMVSNFSTATLPQLAIADFLSDGGYDRHLRRIRRACADRVAEMIQTVGESFPEGTRVTRPAGGFVIWIEIPGVDAVKLYERALAERISIAPGPLFSAKGAYRECIRLNAAMWSEPVRAAIRRLGGIASEMTP